MELAALVNVHHAVRRRRPRPHRIVQVALDAAQYHLEDAQATAQALARQQIALARNHRLLGGAVLFDVRHNLQRRVLGLEALLFRLGFFALCRETKNKTISA